MKPEAVTVTGIDTRSPDGGAQLCTEHGMAAAHAAHHASMLARARRIVVDPDLAEDVVQEAFLRAWRACSTFDPAGGPLANWLLVITANTAIDMVKARVRRPPLASGSAAYEDAPAAGINDIDLLVLRSQLRQALSSIEAHHREAVVETVLRDRPYADVAAELGVAPGTLRTRVHYGLRRLRCVLQTLETEDTAA
jgi:RNA polymerase sigma-70 factor, ECF subfamily